MAKSLFNNTSRKDVESILNNSVDPIVEEAPPNYLLVKAATVEELQERVNKALEMEYGLIGTPFVEAGNKWLVQAMMRVDRKNEPTARIFMG